MDFDNIDEPDYEFEEKYIRNPKVFDGLNPKQVEAVECLDGPLLIMAGAGSGKTRVLTCRIANLLAHGIAPWNILAITFTNKAANEMKTRAEKMIGEPAKSVWLSTFHSFCAKILRFEIEAVKGYSKNFSIYSTGDSKMVIRDCVRELELDEKRFSSTAVQSRISNAKNALLNAKAYKNAVLMSQVQSDYEWAVADIYELYEKRLLALNAMDFDDLLLVTVRLFENNEDILDQYQEKFRYILVDEYQDTNKVQYRLMKLLAAKYENVCVVGDADQSIYGWRGADLNNILSFEADYPGATVIKLEQNYRSTKLILEAANAVIQNNIYRKPKNLWTNNPEGEQITVFEAFTEYYEALKIADEIKELKSQGIPYSDIALLYRINAQSRSLEEAFMRAGIPYVIIGGLKFYDRLEIKNILAYLRLISNPQDNMSFKRIVNVPKRGIGTTTIIKLQDFAEKHEISIFEVISNSWLLNQIELTPRMKQNIRGFASFILDCIDQKNKLPVDEYIKYILENSGYMLELKTDQKPEDEARIENLGEFVNVAKEFANQNEDATLEDFLNHISLISDLDVINEDENLVSLMTVHSAKGLEFPVVFITGMEEGLFPHVRSLMDERQLEEERRACYVAITRAKRKLYITHAASRSTFGNSKKSDCSRFLTEIPMAYLDVYKQLIDKSRATPSFINVSRSQMPSAVKNIAKSNTARSKANALSLEAKIRMKAAKSKSKAEINMTKRWKQGDRIKHKKWGEGIVLDVYGLGTEREMKVKFLEEEVGIKTLQLKFAPIEKLKD